jgi:hypothetical protein
MTVLHGTAAQFTRSGSFWTKADLYQFSNWFDLIDIKEPATSGANKVLAQLMAVG